LLRDARRATTIDRHPGQTAGHFLTNSSRV
jgi:hypothetical protein